MTPYDGGPHAPSIRAPRFHWLTRWYDPIPRATLRDGALEALLVEHAGGRPGQRVRDLGCGTATLTIMLTRACPDARGVGLDDDPAVLSIARGKIAAARLDTDLRQGSAACPPFVPASVDRVVASLLFHHLTTDDKARALAAVHGLLRPGDGGQACNGLMRAAFLGIHLLDGLRTTGNNARGRRAPLMADASFASVAETQRASTVFGRFSLYSAVQPGRSGRSGLLGPAHPRAASLPWAAQRGATWLGGWAAVDRGIPGASR